MRCLRTLNKIQANAQRPEIGLALPRRYVLKTRIVAALVTGTLICILAGCGGDEFKPQTGPDTQSQMIKPGQPLMPPPGAPGARPGQTQPGKP